MGLFDMESFRTLKRARRGRWLVRSVQLLTALVLMLSTWFASPASAHSAANSPASNYVSKILKVSPNANSFHAAVIEAGNRFELEWKSGPVIEVPDYDGRPYLRIGPNGVEQNQQSNATYLNATRQGSGDLPKTNPDGPPEWKRISKESIARWHDHRVHWMGSLIPDVVRGREGKKTVIQPWTIEFTQGSTKGTVTGELLWVPGPSAAPFWILAFALFVLVTAAAVWAGRSVGRRHTVLRALSALMFLLVVVDAIHLFGIAFGVAGTTAQALGRVVSVGFVSIAAWLLGLIGVWLVARNRADAPYLLTFSGGLMAIVGGFADVGVLSKTSIPFAFSASIVRPVVAITIGLGIGIAVAGVLLTRPLEKVAEFDNDDTNVLAT